MHVRQRASAMKVTQYIMNIFSPLSLIVKFYGNSKEEEAADRFAIGVQKTHKHVNSAKSKLKEFYF